MAERPFAAIADDLYCVDLHGFRRCDCHGLDTLICLFKLIAKGADGYNSP